MTYGERSKMETPALEAAKQAKGAKGKMKALIYSDDRAGRLLWNITSQTLLYSARLLGEIADDIKAIDDAMKWGFGWELYRLRCGMPSASENQRSGSKKKAQHSPSG